MAAPTLQDFTQYRGALTLANAGGVPFSAIMLVSDGGSAITSYTVTLTGGTSGHWNTPTTGDSPTPTAAGVSAQLNGGPYTFSVTATNADGTSAAKTLTINIQADTYTISSSADLVNGLKPIKGTLGGKTIEVAKGSEAQWDVSGGETYPGTKQLNLTAWNTHTGRITLQSENNSNRTILGMLVLDSCQRIDVKRLTVQGYLSPGGTPKPPGRGSGPQKAAYLVTFQNASSDCTFSDCTIGAPSTQDDPSQWLVGIQLKGQKASPYVPVTNITVGPDVNIIRTVIGANLQVINNCTFDGVVIDRNCGNFIAITQNNFVGNTFQNIVMCRPLNNPAQPTDHADHFQSGGPANQIVTNYSNNTLRRIRACYADGNNNCHFIYMDDTHQLGYFQNNWILENLFYDGASAQGTSLEQGSGLLGQYVTAVRGDVRVNQDQWFPPALRLSADAPTGTFVNSVYSSVTPAAAIPFPNVLDLNARYPLPPTVTSTASCAAALAQYYSDNNVFAAPDVSGLDYASMTATQIADALQAAYSAKLNGALKNADGTYIGAFFPDGTWNDGTVYQATPPTAISSSAQNSSITVGEPDTITFQLNAAANQSVTITPAVTGVSGSFSPSTVVIGVGSASGTTDFTPSSTGTASITCTNNRSLTNPAPLLVTVAAAPVGPTIYTQTLDCGANIPYPSAITIVYVLDLAATADVTITPACTLAGSFPTGSTVLIPFGSTTGIATFVPSTTGTATFSATNDKGLSNPANVSTTVTSFNTAQRIVLGIR